MSEVLEKDAQINRMLTDVNHNKSKKSSYENNVKPYLSNIKNWVKLGATNKEIADVLGVNVSTLHRWKNEHSDLNEALRTGARQLVLEIKASLLKQALGYKETESKIIRKNGVIVHQEVVEHYYPPNERACAMLLRNYDDKFIEKGLDLNMKNLNDELNKIGSIEFVDDIKQKLEEQGAKNEGSKED